MTMQSEYRLLRTLIREGQVVLDREDVEIQEQASWSQYEMPRRSIVVRRVYSNGVRVQLRVVDSVNYEPPPDVEAEVYPQTGAWMVVETMEMGATVRMAPPSPANEANRRLLQASPRRDVFADIVRQPAPGVAERAIGPGGLTYELTSPQQRLNARPGDYLLNPRTGEVARRDVSTHLYEIPPPFAITRAIKDAMIEIMMTDRLPVISINRQFIPNHCSRHTANPDVFGYDCGELAGEILTSVGNAKARAEDMGARVPAPQEPRTMPTRTSRRMLLDTE